MVFTLPNDFTQTCVCVSLSAYVCWDLEFTTTFAAGMLPIASKDCIFVTFTFNSRNLCWLAPTTPANLQWSKDEDRAHPWSTEGKMAWRKGEPSGVSLIERPKPTNIKLPCCYNPPFISFQESKLKRGSWNWGESCNWGCYEAVSTIHNNHHTN